MRDMRPLLIAALLAAHAIVAPHAARAQTGEGDRPAAGVNAPEIRRLWMPGASNFLQGESATRVWPVYLRPEEIARASALQIRSATSVSAAPGMSWLHVWVNDRLVADIALRGGDNDTVSTVRLEPGALVPGMNAVKVTFESVHRVDCSTEATYELWSRLNPLDTGIVLARSEIGAPPPSRAAGDLSELFTVAMAPEGVTPIFARTQVATDSAAAARLVRVIDAIERNIRLPRPVVSFAPPPAGTAGLEITVGLRRPLLADGALTGDAPTLVAAPAGRRAFVSIVADDNDQLDKLVSKFVGDLERIGSRGSPAGLRALSDMSGVDIESGAAYRLADLANDPTPERGRHWLRDIAISLPQSFVPSTYEQAVLRLRGTVPGGLSTGSVLRVAVNGSAASYLPLASDGPIDLQSQVFALPFNLFHPGDNKLTIESTTITSEDAKCDSTRHRQHPLVRLSATASTLTFPRFARVQVGPEISRTLTLRNDRGGAEIVQAALPHPDSGSLSAATTLFANLSARGRQIEVEVTYGRPLVLTHSGMMFGAIGELPPDIASGMGRLIIDDASAPVSIGPAGVSTTGYAAQSPESLTPLSMQDRTGAPALGSFEGLWARFVNQLRWFGFAYPDPEQERRLILQPNTLLVSEEMREGHSVTLAKLALPSVGVAPKSWVLVAAQSTDQLADALRALVADGDWDRFSGQAAVFDPISNRVETTTSQRQFYALPADWNYVDVRDATAAVFSDHIVAYVGLLLLMITAFCIATMIWLRDIGVVR